MKAVEAVLWPRWWWEAGWPLCLLGIFSRHSHAFAVASTGTSDIDLSPEAWERVRASRSVITEILKIGKPVYGINTGKDWPRSRLCLWTAHLVTTHWSPAVQC
jgi:hypothetical protein